VSSAAYGTDGGCWWSGTTPSRCAGEPFGRICGTGFAGPEATALVFGRTAGCGFAEMCAGQLVGASADRRVPGREGGGVGVAAIGEWCWDPAGGRREGFPTGRSDRRGQHLALARTTRPGAGVTIRRIGTYTMDLRGEALTGSRPRPGHRCGADRLLGNQPTDADRIASCGRNNRVVILNVGSTGSPKGCRRRTPEHGKHAGQPPGPPHAPEIGIARRSPLQPEITERWAAGDCGTRSPPCYPLIVLGRVAVDWRGTSCIYHDATRCPRAPCSITSPIGGRLLDLTPSSVAQMIRRPGTDVRHRPKIFCGRGEALGASLWRSGRKHGHRLYNLRFHQNVPSTRCRRIVAIARLWGGRGAKGRA